MCLSLKGVSLLQGEEGYGWSALGLMLPWELVVSLLSSEAEARIN